MEEERKEDKDVRQADKNAFNPLEKIKNIKKDQLLIILLIGALLVVVTIPTKKQDSITDEEPVYEMQEENENSQGYEEFLENKLKNILSGVNNVGEVEVMITLKSKGEKIVEKDIPKTSQVSEEADSAGGTRNATEITSDEATVFVEDENGRQVPYVVEELEPKIEGILIIAQGGDNSTVVKDITEAVMALFQVDAHKIKVMKMNNE